MLDNSSHQNVSQFHVQDPEYRYFDDDLHGCHHVRSRAPQSGPDPDQPEKAGTHDYAHQRFHRPGNDQLRAEGEYFYDPDRHRFRIDRRRVHHQIYPGHVQHGSDAAAPGRQLACLRLISADHFVLLFRHQYDRALQSAPSQTQRSQLISFMI